MLIELSEEQIVTIKTLINTSPDIHGDLLKAIEEPIDITDTCPSCGCYTIEDNDNDDDVFIFDELSAESKLRAISDYRQGWLETHPDDPIDMGTIVETMDGWTFYRNGELYKY